MLTLHQWHMLQKFTSMDHELYFAWESDENKRALVDGGYMVGFTVDGAMKYRITEKGWEYEQPAAPATAADAQPDDRVAEIKAAYHKATHTTLSMPAETAKVFWGAMVAFGDLLNLVDQQQQRLAVLMSGRFVAASAYENMKTERDTLAAQVAAAREVIKYVEIMRDLFNASSHRSEDGIDYTRWQEDGPDACYTMAGIMHTLEALAALDGDAGE